MNFQVSVGSISKLLIQIVLLLSFFIISASPVLALIAEPIPRAPLNQRDRYDTDVFTGSAAYTYNVPVPKGTTNLTPSVSFNYNSAGVRDFSAVSGIGWQLNRDYIERDVKYTPDTTGDDTYKLYFQGAIYDLVYVATESAYHTKIETGLNIKKLTTGEQNESNEYWQVTTKDGTKYRFGQGTNSELMCNGRSYVRQWNLDLVKDVHDNEIFYTYSESSGASYLTKIEYNSDKNRIIDFGYTSNPYQRQIYAQGCSVTEGSILNSVTVKINNDQVRKLDLSFASAGNDQQLLQSITEKGATTSALPATTFTYKPEVKTWATSSETWINNAGVDVHLAQTGFVLADANGDGLLDIVKTEHHGGPNVSWRVLVNQGSSWSTTWATWVNNADLDDSRLDRPETRLVDVTGDGLPDIVRTYEPSAGWATWKVYKNTGNSWNTTPETWVNNANIDAEFTDSQAALIDVNADGLLDIVRVQNTGGANSTWKVYKNTGSSWNTTAEIWINNAPLNSSIGADWNEIVDVNGDNLPDIVRTDYGSGNVTWRVYKNTGSSWNTTEEYWINNAPLGDDVQLQDTKLALADVNGDNLVDIVKSVDGGTQDTWKALLNKGNSWSTTWEEWISPSGNVDVDASAADVRIADVNGDSLPDLIKTFPSGSNVTWKVWKNNGHAPDTLSKVTNSQGGSIEFAYANSVASDNTGPDSLSDLPFGLWVVQTMTQDNGLLNIQQTTDITQYTYSNGLYDWQDREFRGFADISTTEPNGAKKVYVLNQDDAKKGRLASLQTNNSSGNPYAKIEQTWSNAEAGGIYTVNLTQEKNYTYDGTASNPKIIETDYFYDIYGNATKISEKGDTSTGADDRFTYNEFTYNTTDWIVNTPKRTYKNASNDSTKVSESTFYYDGNSQLTDAPINGDLTKKVDWLNGGTSPETTYTYDSYGNVTSVTDPNNRTTTYTFGINDTTYTYPERETNAKNQQTNFSYDLGTGNLLSKTDPNGFTTTYAYDTFGRLTKEIKPYDSSTYPTVSYEYSFDGIAPESTLISKREVSTASGTLDSYIFIDGLSRTIQVKTEAEDTSKQIVADTFYDANGEVEKQTVPHLETLSINYATPGAGLKNTSKTFDALDRVTIVTNPKGDSKTTAYDHWKETDIDENGRIKRRYFDAFGQIVKVEEVNNLQTNATNYMYNSLGNLTQIIDYASNSATFTYDTLGRKTGQADPDMGTWQYSYDGAGNQTGITDARTVTTTKTYDELNRLTLVNYPNDTDNSFQYDISTIGTLSIATDSAGTVSYSYDNRLRKTQEQRTVNGTTKTTQFSYDAADRMVTQTNPDGEVVTYVFNAQGEVNSVSGTSGIVSNIDYNALGKITQKDFANSKTTTYTYNTDDFRLNRLQTGSVQDLGYTYDAVGNVKTRTNNLTSKTELFNYDDLDRLLSASESAGYDYAYEYTPGGNLTKFTDSSSGDYTDYDYGAGSAGPHALTSSTASATAAMNISSSGTGYRWYGNTSSTSDNNKTAATGINDQNYDTDVKLTTNGADDDPDAWEAAGMTWSTTQADVNKVVFKNGSWISGEGGNGVFTANFKLQFTTDGNTWVDSGWSVSPSYTYDSSSAGNTTYTFTGAKTSIRGARVVGQVRTTGASSWYAQVKEVNVWTNSQASQNIASNGTGYRWSQNTTATANTNRVAATGINDGNESTDIDLNNGADDNADAWEGAGVTWSATQSAITSVQYVNGSWTGDNNGAFTANFKLQFSTDGTTWADSGWSVAPAYDHDSSASSGKTYTFTGSATSAKGVRVVGQVRTSGANSWHAFARELKVFSESSQSGSSETELLTSSWQLTGNNGDDQEDIAIAANTLNGKVSVKITFDLNGTTFGTGDDEASIIFIQNSDWYAVNVVPYAVNGYDGSQTIQIPLTAFEKVGTSLVLDPEGSVSNLHTRFWNSGSFTVDITSVKVLGASSSATFTYDVNGNMTSDGTKCFEYNEANQLKKVKQCSNSQTIAEYIYDYDGLRMVKKNYTSGTLANSVISWSDSFETKVIVGGATENTSYYFANKELIAKKDNSGNKTYFHNDHLGSTSVTTNQAGSIAETTTYDPWGEIRSGGTQNKFLYTGQEKDSETGLNYYNARYYNSDIRRFTQPDDIIQNVYNPQTLNRYSYVRNNPLRYTDPSGHIFSAVLKTAQFAARLATFIPIAQKVANTPAGQKTIQQGQQVVQRVINSQPLQNTTQKAQGGISNLGNNLKQSMNQIFNSTTESVGRSTSITSRYSRPSGATTKAMREAVNAPGTKCHTCGKIGEKMVPDHKPSLVEEYYETGAINLERMRSIDSILPQCISCSRIQGGTLSNYSKQMIKELDL